MSTVSRRQRLPADSTGWQHQVTYGALIILLCWHLTAAAETSRTLHIRSVPAISGYSSSLYEVSMPPYFQGGPVVAARAMLSGSSTEAEGDIMLEQAAPPFGPVTVVGQATGLVPGRYRLFITTLGDLKGDCDSLRPAISPYEISSDPEPSVQVDLGGVEADEDGKAHVRLLVPFIALSGPRSVAGRGVVLRKDAGGGGSLCGSIAYSRPTSLTRPPKADVPEHVSNEELTA